TASPPSARSASVIPCSEPRASPSGFSCVTTTKRSCSRSASTTALSSDILCPVLRQIRDELVDQPRHADPSFDRVIVGERQRGRPPKGQLTAELRLQHAVRRLEPGERGAALARAA